MALRAAPAVVLGLPHVPVAAAIGVVVAEPGPDLVAGPLEEAALLAVVAGAPAEGARSEAVLLAAGGAGISPVLAALVAEDRAVAVIAHHVAPVEGRSARAVAGGVAEIALAPPVGALVRAAVPAPVEARPVVAEAAAGDVAVILPLPVAHSPVAIAVLIIAVAVVGHESAPHTFRGKGRPACGSQSQRKGRDGGSCPVLRDRAARGFYRPRSNGRRGSALTPGVGPRNIPER